jgi:hypothetical protein
MDALAGSRDCAPDCPVFNVDLEPPGWLLFLPLIVLGGALLLILLVVAVLGGSSTAGERLPPHPSARYIKPPAVEPAAIHSGGRWSVVEPWAVRVTPADGGVRGELRRTDGRDDHWLGPVRASEEEARVDCADELRRLTAPRETSSAS